MSQSLPGGLVLRTARPSDLDQIAALLADRGEPADAVDHQLVVEDAQAGWESCAVVADGDRVVSTATLLDETLILDNVTIPAGQVELVATDRAYEGRGLVRALMGWAHERSASLGHLAQVMIGIPYFYRQFGYQYAIVLPQSRAVRAAPSPDREHLVRTAGAADIPAMAELQDAAQRPYDLRMPHSPACWRWLVARDGSTQLLVERAGVPVATARITSPDDDEVVLGEIAAADPAAARALLGHAVSKVGGDVLRVMERGGPPGVGSTGGGPLGGGRAAALQAALRAAARLRPAWRRHRGKPPATTPASRTSPRCWSTCARFSRPGLPPRRSRRTPAKSSSPSSATTYGCRMQTALSARRSLADRCRRPRPPAALASRPIRPPRCYSARTASLAWPNATRMCTAGRTRH